VVTAARALLSVPADRRAALLSALLWDAAIADRHRRRTGRSHPVYGDGSLMATALARGCVREPGLQERDYCLCLAQVLIRLAGPGAAGSGR
jgi:hypothetical protein